MSKTIRRIVTIMMAALIVALPWIPAAAEDGELHIYFVDVGQADSAIIT